VKSPALGGAFFFTEARRLSGATSYSFSKIFTWASASSREQP
jgi:hypothetical protein